MTWSAQKTMNTTRERWIVEWDLYRPHGTRSPVGTGFFKREHVKRQLGKLQADSNVRWVRVTRVVPVVRWKVGTATAIEQLDAFPEDEVEPLRWNVVWVTKSYPGPPGMPGSTWFRKRESLRQRICEIEQWDSVTAIYVTHVCDVTSWLRSADDMVEGFDTFLQRSSLPEPPQLKRNLQ